MKYPQLVSPRAVNAISDWLVSRLEQLGVESPQIYTRLLLSLLQSSVQVNDPIEFSNLEAFFANRKGGNKRFHLPSDTETLKKLNAVQCLREIVSNEQETATIEQLVDELCEKLNDIEKQTQNLSDDERFLIETHLNTDALVQTHINTQLQRPTSSNNHNPHPHNRHHQQQHYHHYQQQQQQQQQEVVTQICNKQNSSAFNADSKRHHVLSTSSTTSDSLNDLDNDPKKRYFRAFPALSKEMEDSFRIWRRNAKSLTWPLVGRSIVVDNNLNNSSASLSSSSASSITSSANFGANSVSSDKTAERRLKGVVGHQLLNKVIADSVGVGGSSGNIDDSDVQQQQKGAVGASAKKKSKRRRNQALCKGKTTQNLRKLSVGTASNSVSANKYHQYSHHRNSSPAWDTDFKGCWEMGPDLIKEFLSRQNETKRKRSSSECMDHEDHNEHEILKEMPVKNDESPIMKRYIDLSFCYDDDDDDDEINNLDGGCPNHYIDKGVDYVDEDYEDYNLTSVSELTMDNFNPKRLYQRESHSQNTLEAVGANFLIGNIASDNNVLEKTTKSEDPLDFQQFKAKFNTKVEALWKDIEPINNIGSQQPSLATQNAETSLKLNNPLGGGISSAFYANTSLNALAPFKQDLWNFWSNYQTQHFDQLKNKLSNTASTSSVITATRLDDSSASSGAGGDIGNSSDYFSMPSNLNDFDKSVGSVRRTHEADISLGAHTPSINVFLQNSIWSTSGDCVDTIDTNLATDTDESFLYKVWHSNKKLTELDVGNAVSGEKMPTIVDDNDGVSNNDFNKSKGSSSIMVNNTNLGANLQFPSYQNLKWSEGINAGPPYSYVGHHNEMHSLNNNSSMRIDNNFASFSSVASISGATWEAPAYGQNTQPDLKSWCASNPMSLTEMYGNDVCDSVVNQPPVEEPELNQSEVATGPAVTLANHCANTSGFVAYSRVKQCGIVQPKMKPLQASNASRLSKDFFRSSEEENLLTSERTHFHPIENFVDGHTFDISNDLDPIEFDRTSSGLMRYESEEYLEYTRNDIYMADEEVSTNSTNLLKYSRKAYEDKDKKDKFIIKFRVKRCGEIACQTEEQDLQLAPAKIAEIPTSSTTLASFPSRLDVNNVFNNTFSLSRQANNEAIMAAVTKAVAAAAKAAAENHINAGHFSWLPVTNINTNTKASDTNTKENDPQWRPDICISDEVDFCSIDSSMTERQQKLVQRWSMQEVEKQCHQRHGLPHQQQEEIKRKYPTKPDIERSDESSMDNTSLHTLWGMCAVCNSCESGKSMPADRLLRDELEIEADEIMSDLRYMQDLYIGESDILNEANETQLTKENQLSTDDKMFDYFNKDIEKDSIKNPWNMMDIKENKSQPHDPVQVTMLQKVNQLIEDLLKTENTGKLAKETAECDNAIKQTELSNVWNFRADENKMKNLWQFNQLEGNNTWQQKSLIGEFEGKTCKSNETFEKPIKLLKQAEGSLNEDSPYSETLNWKHDNLAKIWQDTVPTSTQLNETLVKNKQTEMANNFINTNLLSPKEEKSLAECSQKLVEEKNLKNLQNTTALKPPSSTILHSNSYKRVQQFLNNSAVEMKLIGNRKRRHSASQNFYQQQHLQCNKSGNSNKITNNNNDNITDLNAYKHKISEPLKLAKEQPHHLEEITALNNTTLTGNLNSEEQPKKQTIITCKYWTAATNGTQSSLDSAAAAMMLLAAATNANNANDMLTAATADDFPHEDLMLDENIFGNTFSCLIDKNSSILKHMTMMTRPLTR